MPQKQNPVRAAIAIAAAVRAPGLVSTMLSAMPQEHERGLGEWQAEWNTMPQLVLIAGDAASALADALQALVVDPARMRDNLDITKGLIFAEAVTMGLAPRLGKEEAHARVARAARRASDEGRPFLDLLCEDPAVTAILDRAAINKLLSPETSPGATAAFVARALSRQGRT
jgi:3-carboxy-cis,cis-muconate cycloisomerase